MKSNRISFKVLTTWKPKLATKFEVWHASTYYANSCNRHPLSFHKSCPFHPESVVMTFRRHKHKQHLCPSACLSLCVAPIERAPPQREAKRSEEREGKGKERESLGMDGWMKRHPKLKVTRSLASTINGAISHPRISIGSEIINPNS
jgi:hypothetical protein